MRFEITDGLKAHNKRNCTGVKAVPFLCNYAFGARAERLSAILGLLLLDLTLVLLTGCSDANADNELYLFDEIEDFNETSSDIVDNLGEFDKEAENKKIITGTSEELTVQDETFKIPEDSAETMYVYVCGCVVNPGVYELTPGSLLADAVKMAGGFSENADTNYVNLASRISDGLQIYIPDIKDTKGLMPESGNGGVSVGNAGLNNSQQKPALININTATEAELMTLPGVGQSKAGKIIAYRDANGPFKAIEDIMKVDGIKNGMYDKVKDLICVY